MIKKASELLLDRASEIGKRHDKIEKETGYKFNLFSITKIERYEVNTHSAMIAELLNPQGSHGQGNIFLKLFVKNMPFCNDDIETTLDYSSASITTEEGFNSGKERLDIIIKFQNYWILIENKVDALDGKEQLKRYTKIAKNNDKKYSLIYLTKNGADASEQSSIYIDKNGNNKTVDYKRLSYGEDIIAWLELCIKEVALVPIVREAILQYLNIIKKITGNDMTSERKTELVDLLLKEDNLKTAVELSKSINDAKGRFLFEFFKSLEMKAIEAEYKLETDKDILKQHNVYDAKKCKQWFQQSGKKVKGLGIFIATKNPNIIFRIVTATNNFHYGFELRNNADDDIKGKKKMINEVSYEGKDWEELHWYSTNCGNIRIDMENLLQLQEGSKLWVRILDELKNINVDSIPYQLDQQA